MTVYLQICGIAFLAVVLVLTLKSTAKDLSAVLSIAATCLIILSALQYLQPIIGFLKNLEGTGELDAEMTGTLLKITGIGILSEISNLVCKDSGNESLGKSLELLGNVVILYLSMPLFSALLDLTKELLGAL